jgi:hypothetical protein
MLSKERHQTATGPFGHFTDRISALNDLRHSVLFELVCKPYSLVHIRLSLVPKLPSKTSTNLGAPQSSHRNSLQMIPQIILFYAQTLFFEHQYDLIVL